MIIGLEAARMTSTIFREGQVNHALNGYGG